jgi:hypothetical protein
MTKHDIRKINTRERRRAWDVLRNSTTMRMAAAIDGAHGVARRGSARVRAKDRETESNDRYYQRRSKEEHQAAQEAADIAARKAHRELARLYAGLARYHALPPRKRRTSARAAAPRLTTEGAMASTS